MLEPSVKKYLADLERRSATIELIDAGNLVEDEEVELMLNNLATVYKQVITIYVKVSAIAEATGTYRPYRQAVHRSAGESGSSDQSSVQSEGSSE